jgi:uncharacterized membrane protein
MAGEDRGDGGFEEVAVAAAERLTFFSDAVVAIAITLLAIDLPVPEGNTSEELVHSLGEHYFEYLAFFISFAVIANHWRAHHRIFRWVRRADPPVIQLNLLWLLLVVLNPFLTRMLTEGDQLFLRFALYAAAQGLQMVAMALMIAVMARREWFAPEAPASLTRHGWVRSTIGAATFLVSIPVYLAVGQWAFVVWLAMPLLTGPIVRWSGGAPSAPDAGGAPARRKRVGPRN